MVDNDFNVLYEITSDYEVIDHRDNAEKEKGENIMKTTLKQTTIDKIVKNTRNGDKTKIGQYYYKADLYRGYILRCHRDNLEREWLTYDGQIVSGWEIVAEFARCHDNDK